MNIAKYLPSSEILNKYLSPGPYEIYLRDKLFRPTRPGCDFALISAANRGGDGLWIVPAWHPLALVPEASPGIHYAQGWFEGGSVRPEFKEGEISRVNIVLEGPRNDRFNRSAKALGVEELPVSSEEWKAGIRQLVGLFDPLAFLHEGQPVRVYLRPAGYREGDFGVTPKGKPGVNISCIGWKWPLYLPGEVYEKGGMAAAFVDQQRLDVVRGKVFGNYTFSGEVGKRAREIGAHEAVLFGPYVFNDAGEKEYVNHWEGKAVYKKLAKTGVLADGPGEDVVFFRMARPEKVDKIIVQPRDTGILAGTTREYLIKQIAPNLGIEVEEASITIDDVRRGSIQGMAMCGNAANLAPIRQLNLYDENVKLLEQFPFEMTEGVKKLVERFNDEITGKIKPSHEGLLTPIDLETQARREMMEVFKEWF